ncbi:MAG: response regulator [Butyricicoccus sp.]|nr:response regulator [Butyricicoccus sp.]
MYYCRVQFYLIGQGNQAFELIKQMTPPERFEYAFDESRYPEPEPSSRADVIFACVGPENEENALYDLLDCTREGAQLILLADKGSFSLSQVLLDAVYDVWNTPMEEKELRFRFARWQRAYKARCDAWETSQFLEATINSTPSLIWYKDKDGVHEKVNDSFCETVGKDKFDVQGQRHAYIWDVEEDDPACIESERLVMEHRETCVAEETISTGEGTRLLTTYKSPLYNLDGSVMGTVGVAIDKTQERAYEQELMRQNQVMETIFTSLDCGIIVHTLDGSRIIRVNRAALKILGYTSQDEMTSDGFYMVAKTVLDEDKPMMRERIASLKKPGDSASVEYRVLHHDGKLLHVMGSFKLIEENGEVLCQRFLLDCTAQKQREQAERVESERRHAELLHALAMDFSLVCVFDLATGKGRTLRRGRCKPGVLERVFTDELELQDCLAQYIDGCVYADDREAMRALFLEGGLEKILEDKSVYSMNYRNVCAGEMKYFRVKAVRTGGWPKSRSVVLGFSNVDDETRSELEKKSLLEDALMQANRASKAKSTFLSNMSHDIRTPMNAIVGFTSLALTRLNQPELVEGYLKKILTSGNHLVSLINDVLDMSRIESGKMHLEEALCRLPDILHGLRSIVQGDIAAKQLELFIDTVDVYDEEIYCDKLRLNQVLLNLLSNAIKYTGAGGIVSVRIIEKPGAPEGYASYEFNIRDTGIGMSPEFVEHIFEPFERERNSTISGIQGTGLGMSITKNIVEMMNGSIDVKSEQGAGTEVTVRLTFRLGSERKEPAVIPQLKGCRALVVDDDFNTCDSVSFMLGQLGLRAEWTLSGREAVLRTRQAKMREDNYTVYLIDWMMPDMNGVEVARRVRKEMGEDVPIIVLTAYDWADIEDEAREAGVTAFCSKPLFLSELRSCLHSVVGPGAAAESGEAGRSERVRAGRILLAEDNELNQEIAVAILKEAGFEPEAAGNGREAVDMLKAAGPGYYSLVLMDVQMPVMDGYAATREIRALPDRELASIPIVAMTANAFEEDRRNALMCGMNGHIGKPIDIDKLLELLDELLG